jgi:hypothetical protein
MSIFEAYGQGLANCNKVYNNPHSLPQYKSGVNDLLDFVHTELAPLMADCSNIDALPSSTLTIQLTIDVNGKVVEIILPKSTLPTSCLDALRQKIIDMEGWKPGQVNGQEVCCKIYYPLKLE